tara:strand:+ start:10671 stop:11969 length:1299 start_codon:yes stop_codon:yes gene_type:complete
MNEYDSNRIYDIVKKNNYLKTQNIKDADCYILNTCHIREKATEKVYHEVGRVKKELKNKRKPIVIITGCVAQAEGEILLQKEKYIDAVLGPQSYHQIITTIKKLEQEKQKYNLTNFDVIKKFDDLNLIKNTDSNVSSFLTIQEGCDKFCKFCVVPYTRGPEFSRSLNELLNECKDLVDNGAREITLLGQNVNAYNHNGKKLSDLIYKVSQIENIKRIRYTTSHPIDFSNDLIEIHKNSSKLMPLIHLPIQSGSNKILKSMNRKHTVEDYLNLVEKLKSINSRIKFSSDFIIGYPGEKEEDFNETLKLLNRVEYINTYSFLYSPRPGTPAAKVNINSYTEAKNRLIKFQKKASEKKMEFKKKLFNKISLVLFENKLRNNKNYFFGRDEYFNSVIVKAKENLSGQIKEVNILNGNQNTLFGEICYRPNDKVYAA